MASQHALSQLVTPLEGTAGATDAFAVGSAGPDGTGWSAAALRECLTCLADPAAAVEVQDAWTDVDGQFCVVYAPSSAGELFGCRASYNRPAGGPAGNPGLVGFLVAQYVRREAHGPTVRLASPDGYGVRWLPTTAVA
jgi:hypothetical protein